MNGDFSCDFLNIVDRTYRHSRTKEECLRICPDADADNALILVSLALGALAGLAFICFSMHRSCSKRVILPIGNVKSQNLLMQKIHCLIESPKAEKIKKNLLIATATFLFVSLLLEIQSTTIGPLTSGCVDKCNRLFP